MAMLKPATNKARVRPDLAERNRNNAIHGMTDSKTWKSWKAMRDRCLKPNDKDFHNYGGRGITLCESWHEFINFYSDMGERPAGTSIGRIDNNGNYCKENCRWETHMEQSLNKRTSRFIEYKGIRKSVSEWAKEIGTSRQAIRFRIESGWRIEDVLSPVFNRGLKRRPSNGTAETR
jgi:hypothetical protein